MKRSLKIICVVAIFMTVLVFFQNISPALAAQTPSQMLTAAGSSWNEVGTNVATPVQRVVGTAINVIRIVGTGMAIIMITYVAIKYMSAAPSEKAEFKKSATAMIVGAIVLFAATNILGVIANFASTNI